MDNEGVVWKLKVQAELGRTQFGRDLGEGMVGLTRSSLSWLEDGKGGDKTIAGCRGCGFLSSSEDFPNGCPNCGCHDFSLSEAEDTGNNGGN